METCPNCGSANPLYLSHCKKCSNILRDRVPNIDFWKTFWTIIESPKNTMRQIIQSEKKNFVLFLLVILIFKIILNANYIYVHLFQNHQFQINYFKFFYIGTLLNVVLWVIVGAWILKLFKYGLRIKDLLAVFLYSNLPLIMCFLVLFVPQFVLWGPYLFSNEPSPFLIYRYLAVFFAGIEAGAMLWSYFIFVIGINQIIGKRLLSALFGLLLFGAIHVTPAMILQYFKWLFQPGQ